MSETPDPLWVFAAPFSGSTWLTACLGRHPGLFAVPELDTLLAESVGDLLDIFAMSQGTQGQGLKRAIAHIEFARSDNPGIQLAHSWLEKNRNWSTHDLIKHLADSVSPRRLVIPERDAVLRPIALRRISRNFPHSPALHLFRHPWTQGVLMSAWARERIYISSDFKDHAQDPPQVDPQLPWLRANQNIADFTQSRAAGQYQRVQLESLQEDAGRHFSEICGWLGLEFTPEHHARMQEPSRWEFAQRGPELAPEGLEADAFERYSKQTLMLAHKPQLNVALPWRRDGAGFSPEVIECAIAAGYEA